MTSPIQCPGIYPREIKTCSKKDLETIPYDLYTQGPYGKNKMITQEPEARFAEDQGNRRYRDNL